MFDAFNKISGTHKIFIVLVVPLWTITLEPKTIFFCTIFTFVLPSTIVYRLKVSDTPSLDRNLLSKSITTSIIDIVTRLMYLLNGTAWNVALEHSLIVHNDHSIILTFLFLHKYKIKTVKNHNLNWFNMK